MAYEFKPKKTQEELDQEQSGGFRTGSAGTASGGSVSGPASVSRAPTKPSGGGWVGIEKYLDSNKGEGDRMGAQVSAQISDKGTAATSAVQDVQNKFTDLAKRGTVPAASSGVSGTAPVRSPDRIIEGGDPYKTMAQKSYSGPDSLSSVEGWDNAYKLAGSAQEAANSTKTAAGRSALTQEAFGRGKQYTTGSNRLNTHLIGTTPYGQVQGGYGNLLETLDKANADSRATSAAARTQSETNAKTWEAGPPKVETKPLTQAEEVAAIRDQDRRTQESNRSNPEHASLGDRTRTLTQEERVARYGLTLEQWVAAGKPDLSKATAADLERWKMPSYTTAASPGLKGSRQR